MGRRSTNVSTSHQRSRRFFRSGELHLVLLALLGQRPQHGYELMTELSTRFGPNYRSSPGSIYPALAALEDRRALLAEIEARTGARFGRGSLETALADLNTRVRAVSHLVSHDDAEAVLDEAGTRTQ